MIRSSACERPEAEERLHIHWQVLERSSSATLAKTLKRKHFARVVSMELKRPCLTDL